MAEGRARILPCSAHPALARAIARAALPLTGTVLPGFGGTLPGKTWGK